MVYSTSQTQELQKNALIITHKQPNNYPRNWTSNPSPNLSGYNIYSPEKELLNTSAISIGKTSPPFHTYMQTTPPSTHTTAEQSIRTQHTITIHRKKPSARQSRRDHIYYSNHRPTPHPPRPSAFACKAGKGTAVGSSRRDNGKGGVCLHNLRSVFLPW